PAAGQSTAPAASGLFGATPTSTAGGASSTTTTGASSGGLFGTAASAGAPTFSGFGGASSTAPASGNTFNFGNKPASASTEANKPGTSLFGATGTGGFGVNTSTP